MVKQTGVSRDIWSGKLDDVNVISVLGMQLRNGDLFDF